MEHLQVWWGNVHIARGYLSLQRISPCHLFQYRLHVTLIFFSCEPGTNLRPPVLSSEQVVAYLKRCGKPLEAVLSAVQTNKVLQDLMTTPLILSIITQTYQGENIKNLPNMGTVSEQQQQIFKSYLERMLQSSGKSRIYSAEQMQGWLVWLAQQMHKRSQSLLYLEQLQPDWLQQGWPQQLYMLA